MLVISPTQKIISFAVGFQSVRMLIGAISVVYLLSKEISLIEIGMLKTFQAMIILVFDIPLSYLADKKSRKLTLLISSLCGVLWLTLTGMAEHLWVFFIAEFFNAISISMYGGSLSAYLIDVNQKSKNGKKIKALLANLNKKQFLFMAISAFLGATFIGFQSNIIWFIAASLLFTLWIFACYWLPRDDNKIQQKSYHLSSDIHRIIKHIIVNPNLKKVVVLMILSSLFYQNLIQFWQPAINFVENELINEGYVYGVIFLCILLVQSLAGYVTENLTERQLWFVLVGVFGTLLALPLLHVSYLSIVFYIILTFFCYKIVAILLEAMLQCHIENELRSTYSSVISSIIRLLLLVVMPIFSMLITLFQLKVIYGFYLVVMIVFFYYYQKMMTNPSE